MANLWQASRRGASNAFSGSSGTISRATPDDYFAFNGVAYRGTPYESSGRMERATDDFVTGVTRGLKENGVVWSVERTRISIFSEATLAWQKYRDGHFGDIQGDTPNGRQTLKLFSKPWMNGTTGDLAARMLLHVDFGGNAYVAKRPHGLKCLRPDWVSIVMGSVDDPAMTADDIDAELLGYIYWQGGIGSGGNIVPLMADEVAHFAPYPDPNAHYKGMSWISTITPDMTADTYATQHKLKFFENGAMLSTIVSLDKDVPEDAARKFIAEAESRHRGVTNAYRTLYIGGGADVKVVGSSLADLDFHAVQGAGETRVCAAAGVHPVVVGFSEGLKGSALNAGNFAAARRACADITFRPLWRNWAGSLETLVQDQVPANSRLWWNGRDIAFLQEDRVEAASIMQTHMTAIRTGIDAGIDPDAVMNAVANDDIGMMVGNHTGLYSVQLQPPGQGTMDAQGHPIAPAAPAPPAIDPPPVPMNGMNGNTTNGKRPATVAKK